MFSVREKRLISEAIQQVLRSTGHPELPEGEITFTLNVHGAQEWSWAIIKNNGAVPEPDVNPHNEAQDAGGVIEGFAGGKWGAEVLVDGQRHIEHLSRDKATGDWKVDKLVRLE